MIKKLEDAQTETASSSRVLGSGLPVEGKTSHYLVVCLQAEQAWIWTSFSRAARLKFKGKPHPSAKGWIHGATPYLNIFDCFKLNL